jgi:minor extracellular serine protease Vpr
MSYGSPYRARFGAVLSLLLCGSPLFGQFIPNRYAVVLTDPPVSVRYTGRARLSSTEAVDYRQQLERRQDVFKREMASRNVTVVESVSTLLNAVFVIASPDQVSALRAMPGVAGVVPMRRGKKLMNKAVDLTKVKDAWALTAIGGQSNAGKGVKIGILDTGIDQTHPSFQDSTLPPAGAGFPICTAGHPEDCAYTNNKVIVARSYVRQIAKGGINATLDPAVSQPDDYSPRDHSGHGTAVASVAAGNTAAGSAATIAGVAPKAYLGSYKIYGSPGVNDYPPEDVWIKAIEDALNDGMDIVNFSSGFQAITGPLDTGAACGNATGVACDLLATAFEKAAQQGLIIVAAAGNQGTNADAFYQFGIYNTIGSPAFAPSVLAIGATMNSHGLLPTVGIAGTGAPTNLQHLTAVPSDSYPTFMGSMDAPLIDAAAVGDAAACADLPAGSLKGAFALVQRAPVGSKTCDPSGQSLRAQNAGAVGMIMYNTADSRAWDGNNIAVELVDQFYGPVVGISNTDGVALKNYLAAHPGAQATIDLTGRETASTNSNQLASYSSLGPAMGSFPKCATCSNLLLKPDMVATGGGDIFQLPDPNDVYLAGYPGMYLAAESYDTLGDIYSANGFAGADGTSFASPMVAGAAALVKQAHPDYTAAQVRSALVNSADFTAVTTDDFATPVDIRWTGAGLLNASNAVKSAITAEPASLSFGAIQASGSLPAAQPFTVTNKSAAAVALNLAAASQTGAASANVVVDKATLNLAAGASAVVTASLTGTSPAAGFYAGNINITGTGVSAHVPYQFLVGSGSVGTYGNIIPLFGSSFEGITGQDLGAVAVQLMDANGVPVTNSPVTFRVSRNAVTLRSAPGAVSCSPASSTATVTCNTDNYGIAYVDIVLGAVGTPLVNVTAAGLTATSLSLNIRSQPTTLGVSDSAKGLPAIAPGSYVSIYGTNLSDYTDQETTAILPLSLDGVTASFDVPSAGISAPGRLVYVSPGQVNVQVPWELQGLPAGTKAKVKVTLYQYEYGNVFDVAVADVSPSFFETGTNNVAALLGNTATIITPSAPAKKGGVVQLYANGLGPVTGGPASGEPASSTALTWLKEKPVVRIGGQTADVGFWGLTPGLPGLYQINVTIPSNVSSGVQTVELTIGGKTATSGIPIQ